MKTCTFHDVNRFIFPFSLIGVLLYLLLPINTLSQEKGAFPGAMGWGGETRGAWGHPDGIEPQVIKVISLSGGTEPGTFKWAVSRNYPRIIVFEVGGVINLGEQVIVYSPYLTIAGQTAPSPGVTLINGTFSIRTHDVILQHIMIRQGASGTGAGGGLQTYGSQKNRVHNVIVDHCSITWGTGNHMSATGDSHGQVGNTIEERRLNVSHRVTFQNNIAAEGILYQGGPGENPKGSLTIGNATDIAYIRNLYSKQHDRMPRTNTSAQAVLINNLAYGWDFRPIAFGGTYYDEINEPHPAIIAMIGNYGQHAEWSNVRTLGYLNNTGMGVHIYESDNLHFRYDGTPATVLAESSDNYGVVYLNEPGKWHSSFDGNILSPADVPAYIQFNVGARPWDRDPIDQRIIDEVMNKTGVMIEHENDVGGYPDYEPTYSEFNLNEWNLQYMIPYAGYWEAPGLISPENNVVDVGRTLTFLWESVDIFTYYTIQLATDDEFESIVVDETGITGSLYTVNNLNSGFPYYWRVRGHNATGPSQWSEIHQFNTGGEDDPPLDVPQLNSPEDGNVTTSETILLKWSSTEYAESYTVQVSIRSDFSLIFTEVGATTETIFEVTELERPQKYYWRVRANNSLSGNSDWSEIWKFSVVLEPDQESFNVDLYSGWNQISSYILPYKPAIEDVFADLEGNVVIVRNDNAGVYWPEIGINEIGEWDPLQGYQVYVHDNDLLVFNGMIMSPESTPIHLNEGWNQIAYLRTSIMNVEEALAPLGEKVEIVLNNTGEVYWPKYDINTLDIMVPGQGYKINVSDDVTFTYPASSGHPGTKIGSDESLSNRLVNPSHQPIYYRVDFPNTGNFAILLLISTSFNNGDEIGVLTRSNELVGSGVALNGRALVTVWGRNPLLFDDLKAPGAVNGEMLRITRWSVDEDIEYPISVSRLWDMTGWQLPDPIFRFEVEGVWIAEIDNLNQVPQRYILEQNFPNPFNPVTTIRYSIPETVHVRLEVYDILGQRIQTIVDEVQQAGYHQAVFNADHLASSVYFYRLQAGNYVNMKRFVLMR
jgi:hypothetical protein